MKNKSLNGTNGETDHSPGLNAVCVKDDEFGEVALKLAPHTLLKTVTLPEDKTRVIFHGLKEMAAEFAILCNQIVAGDENWPDTLRQLNEEADLLADEVQKQK